MQVQEQINLYIASLPEWQRKLMVRIRQLVHACSEEVHEAWRGQAPHFDLGTGPLLSLTASKTAVCAIFPQGAHLKVAKINFEACAEGKPGRTLKFHEGDPLNETAFSSLLQRAVAFNLKASEGDGDRHPAHAELEAVLRKDPSAWVNWNAFDKTDRRDYSEWVSDGRKEETRKRRIAQALELIREGLTRSEAEHRVKGA